MIGFILTKAVPLSAASSFCGKHNCYDAYLKEISRGCFCQRRQKCAIRTRAFLSALLSHSAAPGLITYGPEDCLRVSTAITIPLLLLLPACLSRSKSCHHFPDDAVWMLGNCCCVTGRGLSPFPDRATPAPRWV